MTGRTEEESLANVATPAIEIVLAALLAYRTTTPLSRSSLAALGVTSQSDIMLAVLKGHSRSACIAVLEASLAERKKHSRAAPELVWAGPEGTHPTARDAATVLADLFDNARDRVVVVGYNFAHARQVITPLHAAMRDHRVTAHVFVQVGPPESKRVDEDTYAQKQLDAFALANWPFGDPMPTFHCLRQALRPAKTGHSSNLNSKCVIVDAELAFVSSANVAPRAQEQDIDIGMLLRDSDFATQLEQQFLSLIEGDLVYTRK